MRPHATWLFLLCVFPGCDDSADASAPPDRVTPASRPPELVNPGAPAHADSRAEPSSEPSSEPRAPADGAHEPTEDPPPTEEPEEPTIEERVHAIRNADAIPAMEELAKVRDAVCACAPDDAPCVEAAKTLAREFAEKHKSSRGGTDDVMARVEAIVGEIVECNLDVGLALAE